MIYSRSGALVAWLARSYYINQIWIYRLCFICLILWALSSSLIPFTMKIHYMLLLVAEPGLLPPPSPWPRSYHRFPDHKPTLTPQNPEPNPTFVSTVILITVAPHHRTFVLKYLVLTNLVLKNSRVVFHIPCFFFLLSLHLKHAAYNTEPEPPYPVLSLTSPWRTVIGL